MPAGPAVGRHRLSSVTGDTRYGAAGSIAIGVVLILVARDEAIEAAVTD